MSYLARLKALTAKGAVKPQPDKLTKLTKGAGERPKQSFVGFVSSHGGSFLGRDDEADAIEERAALAADCVPACYLDVWARFQCQRPLLVAEGDWRRAIDGAGLFLDAWSGDAAAMQWGAGELFDAPREGRPGGLMWQLNGERVAALGADHARMASGRTIEQRRCRVF
jgi:hypothetical protein